MNGLTELNLLWAQLSKGIFSDVGAVIYYVIYNVNVVVFFFCIFFSFVKWKSLQTPEIIYNNIH